MRKVAILSVIVAALLFSCGNNSVSGNGGEDNDGMGGGGNSTYTLTTIVTGGGTVTRNPDKQSYTSGEKVSVTATPATGYLFGGWSGASTSASATITVVMDGNKAVTANFTAKPTYTLTLNSNPAVGGTVSANPNKTSYTEGDTVTVTATPAIGYVLSGWSGTSSGKNPTTVTMTGNKNVTAFFEQKADAIIITLKYWETKETDFLGDRDLDPRIYFNVIARQGGRNVSNNSTGDLLNKDNVGQSWSGSSRSSRIAFDSSADTLRVEAVVMEKDPLASDDISPGYHYLFYIPAISVGTSGSATLEYGTGKSKVRFDYEFVAR
jgi:uncharacterized repeat protein (TIGR02543 family)